MMAFKPGSMQEVLEIERASLKTNKEFDDCISAFVELIFFKSKDEDPPSKSVYPLMDIRLGNHFK